MATASCAPTLTHANRLRIVVLVLVDAYGCYTGEISIALLSTLLIVVSVIVILSAIKVNGGVQWKAKSLNLL